MSEANGANELGVPLRPKDGSVTTLDRDFLGFFVLGVLFILIPSWHDFRHVLSNFTHKGIPQDFFVTLEIVILWIVGGLSSGNYYLTRETMKEAGTPLPGLLFWASLLINVGLFVGATQYVQKTELFTLFVTGIYVMFSLVNIAQVKRLVGSNLGTEPHFRATVSSAVWLREENGLSVVAFTTILGLLLLITVTHMKIVTEHPASEQFYVLLKAFAGGAATFHLVLSVFKYWVIYRRKDVVEHSLRSIKSAASIHPKSAVTKDLFFLSQPLQESFRKSSRNWFWALIVLAIAACIFAFQSFGINEKVHPIQESHLQQTGDPGVLALPTQLAKGQNSR